MLKRFSRHSTPHTNKPILTDSYWQWYIDSYPVNDKETINKHTPYLQIKFNERSHEVLTLQKYFEILNLSIPSALQCIAILKSPFTQGNLDKSFYLIRMFQLSFEGLFLTNLTFDKFNKSIKLIGAENWDNVMCYMDALLFAMFAKLESFEPILFIPNHSEYLINQLSALLRVYVSLLRSGNLLTTDLTIKICEALMKLGFDEALSHKQQDSATLFEFLTETLNMPLLTFKVDIKHGGKANKQDDEKFAKERILFVSIPDEEELENVVSEKDAIGPQVLQVENDPEESILLEECLEHYFNNSISVKRELERRATLSKVNTTNATAIPEDSSVIEVKTDTSKPEIQQIEHIDEKHPITTRTRTTSTLSIWSINDSNTNSNTGKEVNLPAWMFLRLLPFYTDDNIMSESESIAKTSKEFANRRPILPICLKRYQFNTGDSSGSRSQKRIIIPPFIDLPQFVVDDVDEKNYSFRLILESAVCHRGNSIQSGHFISVVRKDTNRINETEEEANMSTWFLYDDMKKTGNKVVEKNFKEIFNKEWPYMLFYRLVATSDVSANSSVKSVINPPHGSKPQYWNEETIVEESVPVELSIPIDEISPEDSGYIDIRNKYYWYFTDEDKNYYKEEPTITKDGQSSICNSPQFRRNSQISNNSNISQVILDKKLNKSIEKLDLKNSSISTKDSNENDSLWKKAIKRTTSPSIKVDSSESIGELHRNISPIHPEEVYKSSFPHTLRNLEDHQKKHNHHIFHKTNKKSKKDAYKKEKCIIQ
ncbi:unnamed protein product [Candida verbasci]|uniref:ubiquitinyl hydrolase 1 n=1 Tax=Candida verbasci TaxID=1227364 RepID=A0A9W4X9C6_9ASCO|nr:unnamed protein product [Candida verbasci]